MSFQFKIQLIGVDGPPVWRRIVVPERFTFMRFHHVIQNAFGWKNSHLFMFSPKGWGSEPRIGLYVADDPDEGMQDCRKIKLSEIFKEQGQNYTYIYDFGDNWLHVIELEKITDEKLLEADCIDGGGNCPPEDCGGFSGYGELKMVMADPLHPEYYEIRDWLGLSVRQKWNADAFDLKKAKAAVRKV